MSNIADKYNKGVKKFDFTNEENAPYFSMEELYKGDIVRPLELKGVYINSNSKFGEQAVAVFNGFYVNLPKHTVETVKEMLIDEEFVQAVNAGNVYVDVEKYYSKKYNKDCYSPIWVDVE